MFMGEKEVFVDQSVPALAGLPEPGEPVFYPKVGHCIYRGLTEDRAAPGKKLVELEDLEEGSRILIPTERVPKLGLRPAGRALEEIQQELSAEFEQPLEDEQDLDSLIGNLVSDGSPRNLAKGLKRLHLLRQTAGLSREEEQTRRKIRSWLAAEVALSKDCTRAEAQALITRILQEAMNAHRRKEREEAKERRRQVKAQKAAEDAALKIAEDLAPETTPDVTEGTAVGPGPDIKEDVSGAVIAAPVPVAQDVAAEESIQEGSPETPREEAEPVAQEETQEPAPETTPTTVQDRASEEAKEATENTAEDSTREARETTPPAEENSAQEVAKEASENAAEDSTEEPAERESQEGAAPDLTPDLNGKEDTTKGEQPSPKPS
jgi:RNA polymerase-interacting CarD/CdnL/TRCF family regulator